MLLFFENVAKWESAADEAEGYTSSGGRTNVSHADLIMPAMKNIGNCIMPN
jgi:hypothetical protein